MDILQPLTREEIAFEERKITDSLYTEVLKLKPGIIFDITKIRELGINFRGAFKNNKNAAWNLLSSITANITETFLKKEADRIFRKNFPTEEKSAYELSNSYDATIFKELIAPFKGKILLVDFWATTCGPCVYNIKQSKQLREKYKNSQDVEFIFITPDDLSPENAYNNFVKEQELIHTYRIKADHYHYLRQLFRFNGIPRYVLVDKEGRILDDNFSSYQTEMRLKELVGDF
jgi:thiol-disulfide isomerase/thioredoxin